MYYHSLTSKHNWRVLQQPATTGNNLSGFASHFAIQISYTCDANLSSVAYNSDAAVAIVLIGHFLVKSSAVIIITIVSPSALVVLQC